MLIAAEVNTAEGGGTLKLIADEVALLALGRW
jgi:hypothetical protein